MMNSFLYKTGIPVATVGVIASLLFSAGCADKETKPETISAVKVFEVGKKATGQSRRISGKVHASDQSELSFGVSGKVVEIIPSSGQDVAKGQLLARIDDDSLTIKLSDARASLSGARAKESEATATLERIQKLSKQGGASKKELLAAVAARTSSESNVKTAEGALRQAEINLSRSKLVAPFAGKVGQIHVDQFQEVSASSSVLTLQATDILEVNVRIPETMIRNIDFGQIVQVSFPSVSGSRVVGTVSSIASEAQDGNAYPITVRLWENDLDLRPGMTASVIFNFDSYLEDRDVFLVPLSAIAIDAGLQRPDRYSREAAGGKAEAPVFVLNSEKGVIEERKVQVGALRDNELEVYSGLAAGDLVVVAGVAFIHDGMRAKRWINTDSK